jgi:hypothetical protein
MLAQIPRLKRSRHFTQVVPSKPRSKVFFDAKRIGALSPENVNPFCEIHFFIDNFFLH